MPNEGHIILPLSAQLRYQGEMDEYDRNKKTWKRPTIESRRMVGKTLEIENFAVPDGKGGLRSFNPLQVACLALKKARQGGFDVIRVRTPGLEKVPGEKLLAEMDFSVPYLCKMGEDEAFFPSVKDGKIKIEDAGINEFPQTWNIDPASGKFAPRG